jgi:peptidoglycan-associated lipoprotein
MKAVSTLVALSSALLACSRTPPPAAPTPTTATANPSPPTVPDKSPSRAVINVSDEIRRACGIADSDAHFAFDSTVVRNIDYPTLDKLVRCFSSGPLAQRQMRLVGHADPRGSDEYNLVLAGSRADGVRTFLNHRGLRGAQMATSSRGEMEAKGTDETSWAQDRRVDIFLAN